MASGPERISHVEYPSRSPKRRWTLTRGSRLYLIIPTPQSVLCAPPSKRQLGGFLFHGPPGGPASALPPPTREGEHAYPQARLQLSRWSVPPATEVNAGCYRVGVKPILVPFDRLVLMANDGRRGCFPAASIASPERDGPAPALEECSGQFSVTSLKWTSSPHPEGQLEISSKPALHSSRPRRHPMRVVDAAPPPQLLATPIADVCPSGTFLFSHSPHYGLRRTRPRSRAKGCGIRIRNTTPHTSLESNSSPISRHPLHDGAARLTLASSPQTYLPVTLRLVRGRLLLSILTPSRSP